MLVEPAPRLIPSVILLLAAILPTQASAAEYWGGEKEWAILAGIVLVGPLLLALPPVIAFSRRRNRSLVLFALAIGVLVGVLLMIGNLSTIGLAIIVGGWVVAMGLACWPRSRVVGPPAASGPPGV